MFFLDFSQSVEAVPRPSHDPKSHGLLNLLQFWDLGLHDDVVNFAQFVRCYGFEQPWNMVICTANAVRKMTPLGC